MKKNAILLLFMFAITTLCFAQSEERKVEISELAKRYSDALCNCSVQDFIETAGNDFKARKTSPEEFQEEMKMVGAQFYQCTYKILNELKKMSLSKDEYEFFKAENKRYNTEFFATKKANGKPGQNK